MALPVAKAAYLQRMQLTKSDDTLLFSRIQAWVQEQCPKATPVEVSCSSLVLQRLARAFAARPSKASPDKIREGTPSPSTSTTAATAAAPSAQPKAPSPAASSPATATATTTTTPPSSTTTTPPSTTTKPLIRSAKKLDLSAPVAQALKDVASDLANTLPVLMDIHQDDVPPTTSMSNAAPKVTVVDILQQCYDLLGKPMTMVLNGTMHPANGAMALYRAVLLPVFDVSRIATGSPVTTQNTPPKGTSMTLDEVKFKTFCTKALESAIAQTISLVEAFTDYQFVWDICQYEHSMKFPTASVSAEAAIAEPQKLSEWQQHRSWQLTCYLAWKWQESSPEVCSRRQRLVATATSLALCAILPVLTKSGDSSDHTKNGDSTNKDPINTAKKNNNVTNGEGAGKRPRDTTTITAEGIVTSVEGDGENNAKRPCGPASPPTVQPDLPASVSKDKTSPNSNNDHQQQPEQRKQNQRLAPAYESVIRTVLLAAKQACSFLTWSAAQTDSNKIVEAEISRDELEMELIKATTEMMNLSGHDGSPTADMSWTDMLQTALGGATGKAAELAFFALVEKMLQAMTRVQGSKQRSSRVETLPYIRDGSLTMALHLLPYLCSVVRGRRKVNAKELVAMAPGGNATPWKKAPPPPPKSASKPLNPRSVLTEDADSIQNAILHNSRAAAPPVITEGMELNEWTIAILASLSKIRPSPGLVSKLDATSPQWRDVVTTVVNRFLFKLHHNGIGAGSPPLTVNTQGELVTATISRTQDTQFCAVCIAFYYHALEAMLYAETDRLETSRHPKLVLSQSFHRAMLTCCYTAVLKAVTNTGKIQLFHNAQQPDQSLDLFSILQVSESTPYNYLKVTDSFLRSLTLNESEGNTTPKPQGPGSSPLSFAYLPRILQKEIRNSEVQAIESLIWAKDAGRGLKDSCLISVIEDLKRAEAVGRKKSWPPDCLEPSLPEELEDESKDVTLTTANKLYHAEFVFVSFIMRKLLKNASTRITSMCQQLNLPEPIPSQVWLTYRFLVRHHVDVLFGRHIDQLIVCTIYGICKTMKYRPDVTFARLIDAYVAVRGKELGERACQAIVRNVSVSEGRLGSVIELYNLVFVPAMKRYLLNSKPLRRNAMLLKEAMAAAAKKPADQGSARIPTATASTAANACAPAASIKVCEGNVSLRLTLGETGGKIAATNRRGSQMANGTTMVASGVASGALPEGNPQYRTVLQLGQASKNLALTNEMVSQATVSFSH